MVIFPLAPDQTIAQMWSNGAQGCVSVEDFDGSDDGESTTILHSSGQGVCCDKKEVQLSQRLTDGTEAGLCQLATDCLRVFRYSFVAFNLAESVSLLILFFCD